MSRNAVRNYSEELSAVQFRLNAAAQEAAGSAAELQHATSIANTHHEDPLIAQLLSEVRLQLHLIELACSAVRNFERDVLCVVVKTAV
jgi:hypothetical protein